ncbi:hypothetical protein VNO78_31193 [Psophocarpus tetragonolobus]|uniref:Uncharacterized protein n=1 Tax=Psophocarpus tetragonolobus TaxID=3891 RepID=A0AAN9RY65_PSOTE
MVDAGMGLEGFGTDVGLNPNWGNWGFCFVLFSVFARKKGMQGKHDSLLWSLENGSGFFCFFSQPNIISKPMRG